MFIHPYISIITPSKYCKFDIILLREFHSTPKAPSEIDLRDGL